MERQQKLQIAILVVGAIGLLAIIWGAFLSGPDLHQGDRTILVLAADETEPRPGLGAVDMAFLIRMEDGSIKKYQPVYPGGMRHPSAPGPAEAQAQGAGHLLLLHDSLWDADNRKGMQLAKEIVEHNRNISIDAVVAVNTEAIDKIINAAGQLKVNGTPVNISAIDLVRENDQMYGGEMTRGDAVLSLARALSTAATEPAKRESMVKVALDEFSKGSIVASPEGSFMSLVAAKGFESLVN